jgi:ribose-phosphate pyrophosphokinase
MRPPLLIFNGSSHPFLGIELSNQLGVQLGKRDLHLFPDGEIRLAIHESVQGNPVYVLQALGIDPNFHLMELFILIDALKRSAAGCVTVVLPYYAYARQDRQDLPGTPITAKLVADLLTRSGADRLMVMDLHSEQIEGFFDMPVTHLQSHEVLIPYCKRLNLEDVVVVAPDKGGIRIAGFYAKLLDAPIALIDKERVNPFEVKMRLFVGEVRDKTVLLVDDMCSTGGTLVHAAKVCSDLGARRIIAAVGHGLFIGNSLEDITESSIELVITTNTVPASDKLLSHPKIRVVSIAPLLAETIRKSIYTQIKQ